MQISVNETEVEYTLLTWDDLLESTFSNDSDLVTYYWHYTTILASFACFEISLDANSTILIHVLSNYIFTLDHIATAEGRDNWEYQYIFGSARTFDGDTLQRIHIHLVEVEPLFSKSFEPEEYLTLTEDGNRTDAIWEFNVSSIEENYIRFSFDTPFTSTPTTITTTTNDIGNTTGVIWTAIGAAATIVFLPMIEREISIEHSMPAPR